MTTDSMPAAGSQHVRLCQGLASVDLYTTVPAATRAALDTLYAYRVEQSADPAWTLTVTDKSRPAAPTKADVVEVGPRLAGHRRGHQWWVPVLDSHITLDPASRAVTVSCPNTVAAHWTVRLTRQLMTSQHLTHGAVYAHAAAFQLNDVGVAVTGLKGSGKTTVLLAALQHLGADLITNDRLLLDTCGDEIRGQAWPHRAHIGIGTLSAYPHLTDLVYQPLLGRVRPHHREKAAIEPPDFAKLLRGGVVAGGTHIALMVWPHLAGGRRRTRLKRVSPDEVHACLTQTQLFMTDGNGYSARTNHWLGLDDLNRYLEPVVDAIAATVPCYRLHGGIDPFAIASAIRDVIPAEPGRSDPACLNRPWGRGFASS